MSGVYLGRQEYNAAYAERLKHVVGLYKNIARPILKDCRVFHHTPVQRHVEQGDWCVLEYAASSRLSGYVGVFGMPGKGCDEYVLRPRGLDSSRQYSVYYDNLRVTSEVSGFDLMNVGLAVRVGGKAMSELIVFEAMTS